MSEETPTPNAEDILVGEKPGEDEPAVGLFEQLAAERKRMQATVLELPLQIPTWEGSLVGIFRPLTPGEKKAADQFVQMAAKALGLKGEALLDASFIHRVGIACKRLEYHGQTVPGEANVSGWTREFAEKGMEMPVTENTSVDDIVKKACGSTQTDEFVAFFHALTRWWASPRPVDSDDPFAGT